MRVAIGHVPILHLVGKDLGHLPGEHPLPASLVPVEVELGHGIIESENLRGRSRALRMVHHLIRQKQLAK